MWCFCLQAAYFEVHYAESFFVCPRCPIPALASPMLMFLFKTEGWAALRWNWASLNAPTEVWRSLIHHKTWPVDPLGSSVQISNEVCVIGCRDIDICTKHDISSCYMERWSDRQRGCRMGDWSSKLCFSLFQSETAVYFLMRDHSSSTYVSMTQLGLLKENLGQFPSVLDTTQTGSWQSRWFWGDPGSCLSGMFPATFVATKKSILSQSMMFFLP